MLNMNSEKQLEAVSLTIDQAKGYISKKNALYRLLDNKDFIDIKKQGKNRDEAARLVSAKCDVNMQSDENQRFLDRMIDGVGALRQYLQHIERQGNGAEGAIKEHENTREEIIAEELENNVVGGTA